MLYLSSNSDEVGQLRHRRKQGIAYVREQSKGILEECFRNELDHSFDMVAILLRIPHRMLESPFDTLSHISEVPETK